MENINAFIDSLLNHRSTMEHPLVPDAIANYAKVISPLRSITKNGRALNSGTEYSLNELFGNLLKEYISTGNTQENQSDAIIGQTVLIHLILRVVVDLKPDLLVEEILMKAADQHILRCLEHDFSAIPVFQFGNTTKEIGFGLHEIFCAPIPLTKEASVGFIQRNIIDHLENDDTSDCEFSEESFLDDAEPEYDPEPRQHINLEMFRDDITADPMNGFDDFYDIYFNDISKNDEEDL